MPSFTATFSTILHFKCYLRLLAFSVKQSNKIRRHEKQAFTGAMLQAFFLVGFLPF